MRRSCIWELTPFYSSLAVGWGEEKKEKKKEEEKEEEGEEFLYV